jgi:hypothetical protein
MFNYYLCYYASGSKSPQSCFVGFLDEPVHDGWAGLDGASRLPIAGGVATSGDEYIIGGVGASSAP